MTEPSDGGLPLASGRSVFHIPSLDGLRAVAIFLVFVAHSGLGHLFPGGSFGVVVFFFLSGYLISTLLRLEAEKTGTIDVRRFHWRRLVRLGPPLYVSWLLALGLLALGLLPLQWKDLDPMSLWAQLGLFHNYFIIAQGEGHQISGTGVYWSLAVEMHFYLLFPFLYLGVQRFRPFQQACFFWFLCGVTLLWRWWLVSHGASEDRTYMGSDTRMDAILFGCALGVWQNPMLDAGPARGSVPGGLSLGMSGLGHRAGLMGALGLSGALLGVSLGVRSPVFRETLRYTFQSLALYPIFMGAIRYPKSRPFVYLNRGLMVWIGQISYVFYLVHYVMLFVVFKNASFLPMPFQSLLGLLLSVGVAAALHYGIERPIGVWRKRLA